MGDDREPSARQLAQETYELIERAGALKEELDHASSVLQSFIQKYDQEGNPHGRDWPGH